MHRARRARLAALAVSILVATVALAFSGRAAAGPIDCTLNPDLPECATTTTEAPPTTAPATTTTVRPTTTTVAPTTTTRRPATSTTAEREETPVTTTTTAIDVSTSINLLVPGDGSEGAESTTTTTVKPEMVSSDGTSDAMLLTVIVGALVVLALVVGLLTWRYWRATRPPKSPTVGSGDG